MAPGGSFLYPPTLERGQLLQLVSGILAIDDLDAIDFPEEAGGDATRELAIPFRPGMDDVRVDLARLRLSVRDRSLAVMDYAATTAPPSDPGIVVSFSRPTVIQRLVLDHPTFDSSVGSDPRQFTFLGGRVVSRSAGTPTTVRLVLRPATSGGSGLSFGPPVYADPPFPAPGPMFGPVLAGLTVRDLGSGRFEAAFPAVPAAAWLIQLAHGDEPTQLAPLGCELTVREVHVRATPRNLSILLAAPEGDILLWSHPGELTAQAAPQEITFTPIAQERLQQALQGLQQDAGAATLPIPLRIHSDSGCRLGIESQELRATYLVHPLGAGGPPIRMGGTLERLVLAVPAGVRPEGAASEWSMKMLGRELDAASPLPPHEPPALGLTVHSACWAAGSARFAAAGEAGRPLAAARLLLAVPQEAEAVVELRRDAGGLPGAALVDPIVRQLHSGPAGWVEFELPRPRALAAEEAAIWILLRTNKGRLLWFADPAAGAAAAAARVSADRGATWAGPDPALFGDAAAWAQLLLQVPDPIPPPHVHLYLGSRLVTQGFLHPAAAAGPREYRADGPLLPAAVFDALQASSGELKAEVPITLFSRSVFDLSVRELTLTYAP